MIELSPIKNNDIEYKEITTDIERNFNCEWDDAIHDSYKRYVEQMQEHSTSLHNIRCKVEVLQKEIEALKIDDVIIKAESLCREADTI